MYSRSVQESSAKERNSRVREIHKTLDKFLSTTGHEKSCGN